MTKEEQLQYYKDRLTQEDEVEVIDLLDLRSEDIVERFSDCLEERFEVLEAFFDERDNVNAMMHIITEDTE